MNAVEESLTILSERVGDPTKAVYDVLFEKHPDIVPLFMLDKNDAAKGEMLSQVLAAILDFVENRQYAQHLIATELLNHSHLGIETDVFRDFFKIVRDAVKGGVAGDWTEEMEKDWQGLLDDFDGIIEQELATI